MSSSSCCSEVAEKGKKGVVQPAVSRDTDEAMGGGWERTCEGEVPGVVMGSSLGAYLSNRSSMLEPDALLALPGGSERRAANEEKHGAFTAESVLSCCERDSAENMPLGEMVSRRFREERAGRAGQKSGRVRQEASAVRRALRR